MTALSQFERLESPGLWRENDGAQRRDVIVTFGDASLVIRDGQERALTHWSLAAVTRINPGQLPALYTPDPEADETLELDDELMIAAIETVRTAIARARPHRGRLRLAAFATSLTALVALGVFWLPGALVRHTASVVPMPARADIGGDLLALISRVAGAPCKNEGGNRAMTRLTGKLPGEAIALVMPSGIRDATHLPGEVVLLNKSLVEDFDNPEVAAGFILAETARAAAHDPLEKLLEYAGLRATFRLLTTGNLPQEVLAAYAQDLPTETPAALPDETMLAWFEKAGIPSSPYAYALDVSGETTLGLIEADPMRGQSATPLLSDGEWVQLQGVCGG